VGENSGVTALRGVGVFEREAALEYNIVSWKNFVFDGSQLTLRGGVTT
jgi:hypothetical protein